MARAAAKFAVLLICVAVLPARGQQQTTNPQPPTLAPPTPPQQIPATHPDPPPSSHDAPVPDLATLPPPPARKTKSHVKRALHRLAPACLDAVTHSCWSIPPGDDDASSADDQRFAEDMDVGKSHLVEKNYRGAELRFNDALAIRPNSPEATFRLAEAEEHLGKIDDAMTGYRKYLTTEPQGHFAKQAQKALSRLGSGSQIKR